jgi:hypothetical protein
MKGIYWFMGACFVILAADFGHVAWIERRKRRAEKISVSSTGTVRRSVRDMVAPKEDQS